jgi:hypothetical protein
VSTNIRIYFTALGVLLAAWLGLVFVAMVAMDTETVQGILGGGVAVITLAAVMLPPVIDLMQD